METDLKLAFEALQGKQAAYKKLFDYYDGNQPVMYTASRLGDIFRGVDARFTENWCAVVIDAVKDRINLRNILVPEPQADLWSELWTKSDLALESDDVHEDMLVAGESFVLVGSDGQSYHNDPRLAHVFYEAEYPRIKRMAAKWWVNEDGFLQLSLYYADFIENYITRNKAEQTQGYADFVPFGDPMPNLLGQIPVFHFRMSRRAMRSDLINVLPIQNGINKLLADMMVAAEFGAFKQRYIISSAEIKNLKNAPNELWDIPAADGIGQPTQVGQFDETPLENYLKGIEQLAMATSSITRTPKHYFFTIGSNLSGESLQAMEAPLVKKAQDRIDRCIPVWRDVAMAMLSARDLPSKSQIEARDIAPVYDRPEVVSPRAVAETRELNIRAGMPLTAILRDEGRSDKYVAQVMQDKADEQDAQNSSLASNLLAAQRGFDQARA